MKTASIIKNRYGILQPQISVKFDPNDHWREMRAQLYRLAADIETASKSFSWVVTLDMENGLVYLDLLHASEFEANRGLQILQLFCS